MSTFLSSFLLRIFTITVIVLLTAVLGYHATQLRVVIDPMTVLPASHEFVTSKTLLERVFNQHYSLVVAIESKAGIPADTAVLQKISHLTDALKQDPDVIKSSVMSVASTNAKAIQANNDASFNVVSLRTVINNPEILLQWLTDNPIYHDTLVSEDQQIFTVIAQFKQASQGYSTILNRIQPLIDNERDDSVNIYNKK